LQQLEGVDSNQQAHPWLATPATGGQAAVKEWRQQQLLSAEQCSPKALVGCMARTEL